MFWIILLVFGAICSGSFAVPMKFTPKWKWENIWSVFGFWGLFILPLLLSLFTVPNLLGVYRAAGWDSLFLVFLFGLIWGGGSIAFGTGVSYLGIGLAYSMILGMTIAIGSLVPLLSIPLADIFSMSVLTIVTGVIIIILGIAINGRSAVLKEKDIAMAAKLHGAEKPNVKKSFTTGVILCIIAGILSPMLQFAFIYGEKIAQNAVRMGTNETMAANPIWLVAFWGGFIVNLCYCFFLNKRNQSWSLYAAQGTKRYHLYALIMGILWVGSIAIYGMAVTNMGKKLGPSVGWAIFQSISIVWANLLGLIAGEWKGVRKETIFTMIAGLLILVIGTCIVGWAQFIQIAHS